jgi:Family of unknown function (DUF5906)
VTGELRLRLISAVVKRREAAKNFFQQKWESAMVLPRALAALCAIANWMIWRRVERVNADGSIDYTKPPYMARSPQRHASTSDASTWAPYEVAAKAVEREGLSGPAGGLGFALTGSGIGGVDLDDCVDVDTGEIADWAMEIVAHARSCGCYVEFSPNLTGLHILGRSRGGEVHTRWNVGEGGKVEVFRDTHRYLTVTGKQFGSTGTAEGDIDAVIDELLKGRKAGSAGRTKSGNGKDRSPSGIFHRRACFLHERGLSAEEIEADVRRNPELWQGSAAERYSDGDRLREEIERSIGKTTGKAKGIIAEWNKEYAHVLSGGKSVILQEHVDADGHKAYKLMTSAAFHEWNGEHKIEIGVDKNGEPITMQISKFWLRHSLRRKYDDIGFFPRRNMPNYYNLWSGFGIEPKKGDCSKFLKHVHENVCQGDDGLYRWVIAWFADIFQHPDAKCGTALALRGRMGVGKSKIGEVIGSLLGAHFQQAAEPRYITGRFNSHMVSLLLLHADEGFWAGDKGAEGKLRDLVTGKKLPIEFKGQNAFWVNNYVRLLVTGPQAWVVPAGFEERRFAVLDVGEEHMQDHPYFAAIDEEMDNGGREALLWYLLHEVDCGAVNLRAVPHTSALLEQKLESATPEQLWWIDILSSGVLPGDLDGSGETPCERLFDHYIEHAKRKGSQHRSIEVQIGLFLRKVAKGVTRNKKVYHMRNPKWRPGYNLEVIKRHSWGYRFPTLWRCRKQFSRLMNENFNWGELRLADWAPDE